MKRRAIAWTVVAISMLSGCASSPAEPASPASSEAASPLPIPADLQEQIARSAAIGRQLYVLDKVAAIGTDVLFANVSEQERQGLGGYLPMREGAEGGTPLDSYLVTFFTAEKPPRIRYEIRVTPDAQPGFEAFDPPKQASPSFALFVQARQLAIQAMPDSGQPINPVLVPGEANGEHGILVYLLAGTTKPDVAVFGRHFRSLVQIDGPRVSYMMPLSKTALEIPTRDPNGGVVKALVVSHVVTDFPLETHVFTSLLTKLPVYVATSRGLWLVDGDNIAFLGNKAMRSQ